MKTINKVLLVFAAAISVTAATAQQSFNKIRISGPGAVTLRQGENAMVTTGSMTSVAGSFYHINDDQWLVVSGNTDEEVVIIAPDIKQIDISGIGKLETDGIFKANEIEVRVTGAGKIELNTEATKVRAVISGAGKVELQGKADELRVDISGSGKVDAENFKVGECIANISGSGKCMVDVTNKLTSNISGSGSVYYVNRPAEVINNVSGSGRVSASTAVEKDTTRIVFGKKKILIIDGDERSVRIGFKDTVSTCKNELVHAHWAGFELGINTFMNSDFGTDLPPGYSFLELRDEKSVAVNFNIMDYELKLFKRNIMLVTGLGLTYNNYRFKSDSYLASNTSQVTPVTATGVNLKKNKLVASYLTVPLLIEFNTSSNPRKTVHLAAGVIGGLRVGSHLKLVKEEGNKESKSKSYDDFNLNPFRYDATVRFGFRDFTIFGSYNMAGLFKDNKGPEIYPLTLGIRLVGW